MVESTLKLTNALADPTRFTIYQYIVQNKKEVTVQDIADEFNIHPNVARLHLSKLADVKVVDTALKKTGRGGRPGRVYKLSEKVVQLSFPHRDYQLLANIAIEALASLQKLGKDAFLEAANNMGKTLVEEQVNKYHKGKDNLSHEEKINILSVVSSLIGYFPTYHEEEGHFSFEVYNCPFYESMKENALICQGHNAFLRGAFEYLFEIQSFRQVTKISQGCENCLYHLIVTNEN